MLFHAQENPNNKGTKKGLLLELEENPDVLAQVAEYVKDQNIKNSVRVGFAAETQDLEKNAITKILKKGISVIIGNYVGLEIGFGEIDSSVIIYDAKGPQRKIGPLPKEEIAKQIVDYLMNL